MLPICLPNEFKKRNYFGKGFKIAGWGHTSGNFCLNKFNFKLKDLDIAEECSVNNEEQPGQNFELYEGNATIISYKKCLHPLQKFYEGANVYFTDAQYRKFFESRICSEGKGSFVQHVKFFIFIN